MRLNRLSKGGRHGLQPFVVIWVFKSPPACARCPKQRRYAGPSDRSGDRAMTTRLCARWLGCAVGLMVFGVVRWALLWPAVSGVLVVGRTDLMYVLWPTSKLLVVRMAKHTFGHDHHGVLSADQPPNSTWRSRMCPTPRGRVRCPDSVTDKSAGLTTLWDVNSALPADSANVLTLSI